MAKRRSEVGVKSVVDEIAESVRASVAEGEKRRAEFDQMNADLDKAWGGPDPKPAYQRTPAEVEADEKQHARRFSKEEVESMRREQSPPNLGRIKLTVTWGEEYFQPVQYNGFKVGPLSLEVEVLPGTSVEDAYQAAWTTLDRLAKRQFDIKLDAHLARLQTMGEQVERGKRR